MHALVRALITQKNDAQKGCAMHLIGITLTITRAKVKILPVQFSPSPIKPFLQVQLCPPFVLLHTA